MKKWIYSVLITLSLISLSLGIIHRNDKDPIHIEAPRNASIQSSQGSRGVTTIRQGEWNGVTSIDSSKTTVWKMMTPNTFWRVRLDRDDNKIFICYPANWDQSSHLKLPPSNIVEWDIKPGQSTSQAMVAWEILDKK